MAMLGWHTASLLLSSVQAAQRGLEKCQQQVSSSSTEEARAEAQIGVDLYEAMIDALK